MAEKPKNLGLHTYQAFMNPTLEVLHRLGGSASNQELVDEVISEMGLPEDVAGIPHGDGRITEVAYRCAWARTYLGKTGYLANSERGIWTLTAKGRETKKVNPKEIAKEVRQMRKQARRLEETEDSNGLESEGEEQKWKEALLQVLLELDPSAFERLCQRILRESGFIEVEVTGKSGDGGIDGYGTIRIGGMISFNVLFQSKRYKGSLGASVVRDFRGAMVGRADKGLIITTGSFTAEARKEATRDGAPPIDLIDGDLLVDKLKELGLGVKVAMVESVSVDREWFGTI